MIILLISIAIITLGIAFIAYIRNIKNIKKIQYLYGRHDGWKACEDIAIKRAKEHNYNMDKFLSDILQ